MKEFCIHLHPVPKAKFVLGSSITTSRQPFWNDCNPDSRETRPQITWFSQTYTREESCSLRKKRNPLYSAQEPSLSSCSDQVWNIFFPNIFCSKKRKSADQGKTFISAIHIAADHFGMVVTLTWFYQTYTFVIYLWVQVPKRDTNIPDSEIYSGKFSKLWKFYHFWLIHFSWLKTSCRFWLFISYKGRQIFWHFWKYIWFDLLCLTPLSAIFQLYHGDQF